jgi:hypothetical protein
LETKDSNYIKTHLNELVNGIKKYETTEQNYKEKNSILKNGFSKVLIDEISQKGDTELMTEFATTYMKPENANIF